MHDTACFIAFDNYHASDERRREALFSLANGCLSWRASAPESAHVGMGNDAKDLCHYAGLYSAGWYDDAQRTVNGKTVHMGALVNLPNPFGLTLAIDDGPWLDIDRVQIQRYEQRLDLNGSLLERDLTVVLNGHVLHLRERRFVSMADPSLAVLQWRVKVNGDAARIRLRTQLHADVRNALVDRDRAYEGQRLHTVARHHDRDGVASIAASLDDASRRVMVAVRNQVTPDTANWLHTDNSSAIVMECGIACPPDRTLVIEQRATVLIEEGAERAPQTQCIDLVDSIPSESFDALLAAHQEAWFALWARAGVRASDPDLHRALRFAMWHVLQAVSPLSGSCDQGFPPRGWGEGYYGQIFWDDMFVFPFLSSHLPDLAYPLLEYRHRRLATARSRAQQEGLAGAMFPWPSARSGKEETPPFQCNPLSGHWMPDHTHLQRHVGTAIVRNVWALYLATDDQDLLAGTGGDIILEVACFWSSVARFDDTVDRYTINGVLGPDEYHHGYPGADTPGLDNNVYTNLMAVWTLCRAFDLLACLPAEKASLLKKRVGVDDAELARWDDISRRMILPFAEPDVLSQFDGYTELKHAPPDWLVDERPRLDWLLEARGDNTSAYQLTKQADVLCLLYLLSAGELFALMARLGYDVGPDFLRKTADYHLARITHESSLSKMVCAGALTHLDPATSWSYFKECVHRDLETRSDSGVQEGVHLGAMAGSLDILQRHYLGLRPAQDGLHLHPAPPPELGDVAVSMQYRGARLEAALKGRVLTLTVLKSADGPVNVVCRDTVHQVEEGQALTIACDTQAVHQSLRRADSR